MVDFQASWNGVKVGFSYCGLFLMLLFGLAYIVGAALVGENNTFCNGYWRLNVNFMVYGKSVITVWGYVHGSVWFGMSICGFVAVLVAKSEKWAAAYCFGAVFWVLVFFHVGWWITGNVWIFTNTQIPQVCKDAKIGNNTLYMLYYSMLIIEDVIGGIMVLIACVVGVPALLAQAGSEVK